MNADLVAKKWNILKNKIFHRIYKMGKIIRKCGDN